jgi:hypothetical protein
MIRKPFHDLNISYLGLGNMRLPTVGGERRGPIDRFQATVRPGQVPVTPIQ